MSALLEIQNRIFYREKGNFITHYRTFFNEYFRN